LISFWNLSCIWIECLPFSIPNTNRYWTLSTFLLYILWYVFCKRYS
jgi:hypothetical protein